MNHDLGKALDLQLALEEGNSELSPPWSILQTFCTANTPSTVLCGGKA